MASTIKVDKIEGSTGSTVTVPTGQSLVVTDGIGIASIPTITVAKGGTNTTSYTAGDVLYASGTTTLTKLAKPGTPAGEVLTFATSASAPSWVAAAGGGYQSVQVFTATGTWTKPAGITIVRVRVLGAGGGGGGCDSGQVTSDGGCGGGYTEETIDVSSTSSETVTIGALGAGGASGNNDGSTGGTSSFGSFCSATGGSGGYSTNNSDPANLPKGAAGLGIGGDFLISGGQGQKSGGSAITSAGFGGGTYFGPGAVGPTGNGIPGQAALVYGAGGSGGIQNPTNVAGGDGKAGIVIVEEFK